MAKYVPDVKTSRWVIISPGRQARPEEALPTRDFKCPFCPGNEAMTPPEVYRLGGGEPNQPGWRVRVVPNKFPITDIHEVIIHSPDDTRDIEHLPVEQVNAVLTVYRDRYRAHETNGQVLIFCNHGAHAGASLKHPHSQLAVIPRQINLDTLVREPVNNVVEESAGFVIYCPDFSQWPFEVWIAPKAMDTKFSDTEDNELTDLSLILHNSLVKLEKIYLASPALFGPKNEGLVYNYYIYHGTSWYLRIIPRLVFRAGFELGTGLNVNITDPSEAAKMLSSL